MRIDNIRIAIFFMIVVSLAVAPAISFEQAQNNSSSGSSSSSIEEQGRHLPSWNFAAAGDWSCNSSALATVSNIASKDPELVLSLGDGSYKATADCWFDIIEPIDSKMKIVIGNHDDIRTTLLNQYMNHFNLKKQYYSFNYQNVHFVAMSTELPFITGSDQYNFVRNDLINATSDPNIDWIVVFVHRIMYTGPWPSGSPVTFRNTYHDLFDNYDVDLVLQAHVHSYQRFYPLMYNCIDPTTPIIMSNDTRSYENPEGQIYVTVGTGGAYLDPLQKQAETLANDTDYEIMTRSTFGALNIDVMDDQRGKEILSSKFVANNGAVIDQFNITKTRDNSSSSSSTDTLPLNSPSSPSVASEEDNNLRFNGCRYEAVPSNTSLQPIRFSIAAWFKTNTDDPTLKYIINKGGVGAEKPGRNMNFGLLMTRDGRIQGEFEALSGTDYFVLSPNKYNDGSWHYAVLTYDGSILRLYMDGIKIAVTLTGGVKPDNTGEYPVVIGANSQKLDRYFTGSIDEVRIWNRAITSTEVADQYNDGVFNPRGQVLYLSFP